MRGATRIVERLHLRADSESAARRTVLCLEDAFRTATLPGNGARLIIVRRLHLGGLPRGVSAQSLSLAIESRFSAADCQLVHAAAAGAAGARAVWFRDLLEAHELAALRAATGQPIDGWFWRLAIPALARSPSTSDPLRVIAFSLASLEEAPAALPAWTGTLARAGHVQQLLTALQPGDGTALMRAAGAAGSPPPAPRTAVLDRSQMSDRRSAPVRPGGRRSAADDRLAFVERMLEYPVWSQVVPRHDSAFAQGDTSARDVKHPPRPNPASETTASLPASPGAEPIASPLGIRIATEDVSSKSPNRSGDLAMGSHSRVNPSERHGLSRSPAPCVRGSAVQSRRDLFKPCAAPPEAALSNTAPIEVAASARPFVDAVPTAAGGLLFLVPVLERLGFREWCGAFDGARAAPDTLARQIFHVLLSRLRVAEDDPAWMLAATESEFFPATIPEIWLSGCRRMLRRRARIGLATLVLRPARVMLTATHVDIFFPLNAADVRVRRAGLDIDPGWVPWLLRVVTFHYSVESGIQR
jgi:hypothetical protein